MTSPSHLSKIPTHNLPLSHCRPPQPYRTMCSPARRTPPADRNHLHIHPQQPCLVPSLQTTQLKARLSVPSAFCCWGCQHSSSVMLAAAFSQSLSRFSWLGFENISSRACVTALPPSKAVNPEPPCHPPILRANTQTFEHGSNAMCDLKLGRQLWPLLEAPLLLSLPFDTFAAAIRTTSLPHLLCFATAWMICRSMTWIFRDAPGAKKSFLVSFAVAASHRPPIFMEERYAPVDLPSVTDSAACSSRPSQLAFAFRCLIKLLVRCCNSSNVVCSS